MSTVRGLATREGLLAWAFVLPAVGTIALIALVPVAWTFWESLHLHDLRMPWLGRPFVGVANYSQALGDPRLLMALAQTTFFTVASLGLELPLGLVLALVLSHAARGRRAARVLVLLSWVTPTVVAALVWRFMFESRVGLVNVALARAGLTDPAFVWFADARAAWVPIILADVWKMTPFVALLLLAGLEAIDPALYEAARMDGAGPWRQFTDITWPLLRPALLVTLLFRALDAFRVFDLIYVLTTGGPGTATESVSLYTFTTLLQHLRFGYGSAISVIVFVVTFALALIYIRLLARPLAEEGP